MGLTISYTLLASKDTDAPKALELVRALRRKAQSFKRLKRVDAVHPIGDDRKSLRHAEACVFLPWPERDYLVPFNVLPVEGFIFPVSVGEDCEPLWLGLCRYPPTTWQFGRKLKSGLRGWHLKGFCKTQYASLNGWDHFLRCHTAVIDLLVYARNDLHLTVKMNDEGEYWPGRDLKALRRNLDDMNGLVASAAGALKDMYGADDNSIQSPIFQHPQFEHLEAQGEQSGHAAKLRQTVARLYSSP